MFETCRYQNCTSLVYDEREQYCDQHVVSDAQAVLFVLGIVGVLALVGWGLWALHDGIFEDAILEEERLLAAARNNEYVQTWHRLHAGHDVREMNWPDSMQWRSYYGTYPIELEAHAFYSKVDGTTYFVCKVEEITISYSVGPIGCFPEDAQTTPHQQETVAR